MRPRLVFECVRSRSLLSTWQVEFGTDLATEHERWLAEVAFGTATFVYDCKLAMHTPAALANSHQLTSI